MVNFFQKYVTKMEKKSAKNANEKLFGGIGIDEIVQKLSGGKIVHSKKIVDNVIVVMGAAGGVGTSTVVSNIAHIADEEGLRVLVIDLNIAYPIQHVLFKVKTELRQPDLVSCLMGRDTIADCIQNTSTNVSVLYACGRRIIDAIKVESDLCGNNFQKMITEVRPMFDLVIIETNNRAECLLTNLACYTADSIYVVWDEGLSSATNTERIRRNLADAGIVAYSKMRVILNKRTSIYYSEYPFNRLRMELMGTLPFDVAVIENGLSGGIFCKDGASSSKNANRFYKEMCNITGKMLEIGGYVK